MRADRKRRLALAAFAACLASSTAAGEPPAATPDSTAAPTVGAPPAAEAPHGVMLRHPMGHPSGGDSARARHRFEDPASWARVWDDPERDGWQEPRRIVERLRLRHGMRVADIGAGTGYFEPWLARAVGAEGRVYAVDVETTMVDYLRARAAREETPNVIPVLAAPDDPRIPVDKVDRVLIVDTVHHIDARVAWFTRLRRWLDERSLVVVVDWKPGHLACGPAPEHKLRPEEVSNEMRRAGYRVVESAELQYQYVLVFRLQPAGEAPVTPAKR